MGFQAEIKSCLLSMMLVYGQSCLLSHSYHEFTLELPDPLTTLFSDSIHLFQYSIVSSQASFPPERFNFLLPSLLRTSYPSLKPPAYFYHFLGKKQCILQWTCLKTKTKTFLAMLFSDQIHMINTCLKYKFNFYITELS